MYSHRYLRTVIAALVALAVVGCQASAEPPTTSLLFTEAEVQRATMAEVVSAFGQVSALQDATLRFDTVSGRLTDVPAEVGQVVREGDVLAQLDTEALERQLLEAEADLQVAEAVLREAQADASPAAIQRAEADLLAAQYELAKAEMDLALAQSSGTRSLEQEVADAWYEVQVATDELAMRDLTSHSGEIRQLEYDQAFFQRALRDLPADQDRSELEQSLTDTERALNAARTARETSLTTARTALRQAQERYSRAKAKLDRARSEGHDVVAAARLAQEQAADAVKKATERLEQARQGPDPAKFDAAQTAYDAALAKVESVQSSIENSSLRAPFDGVIFEVRVQEGQVVGASDQIIYLVDPNELHIESFVSEVDVVRLTEGHPVRIRFEAYPEMLLQGEIEAISPRGQSQGGLMMFNVDVAMERGTLEVLPGMTASLKMEIGEQREVVAVPAAALRQSPRGGLMVEVSAAAGGWENRDVQIGMNDGVLAEVFQGLQPGDLVRFPLQEPMEQSPFGPGMPEPMPPVEGEEMPPVEEGEPAPGEEMPPVEEGEPAPPIDGPGEGPPAEGPGGVPLGPAERRPLPEGSEGRPIEPPAQGQEPMPLPTGETAEDAARRNDSAQGAGE